VRAAKAGRPPRRTDTGVKTKIRKGYIDTNVFMWLAHEFFYSVIR
jgi:hypothetical protein